MKGSTAAVFLLVASHFASGCQSPPASKLPSSDKELTPKIARTQQAENGLEENVLPSPPGGDERQNVAVRVLATVNGAPIFTQEVNTAAYQFLQSTQSLPQPQRSEKQREIRDKILNQLIERELVLQDMEARLKKANPRALTKLRNLADKEFEKTWMRSMMKGNGYKEIDKFEEFLAARGLPLAILQRQWVRNYLSRQYLRSLVSPKLKSIGRAELYDYYLDNVKEFEIDDEVEWQDVFVSNSSYSSEAEAKQVAEKVVQRIKAGEDFAKLCKEYDDGDSVDRNGAGIGRKRGEIRPPQIEKLLFEMRDGEIGPLTPIGTGYHVFRLVKRQRAGRKPFDEKVQTEIHDKLRNEMATREMRQIVEDIKSRAVIYRAE